jgi:hypothetical protein
MAEDWSHELDEPTSHANVPGPRGQPLERNPEIALAQFVASHSHLTKRPDQERPNVTILVVALVVASLVVFVMRWRAA